MRKPDTDAIQRAYDAIDMPLDPSEIAPPSIDQLLAERKSTHGEYADHASFTQQIKAICHGSKNWQVMNSHERETLDMVAHKIGRILAGDPHFDDHWRDISGYAKLTADRL